MKAAELEKLIEHVDNWEAAEAEYDKLTEKISKIETERRELWPKVKRIWAACDPTGTLFAGDPDVSGDGEQSGDNESDDGGIFD